MSLGKWYALQGFWMTLALTPATLKHKFCVVQDRLDCGDIHLWKSHVRGDVALILVLKKLRHTYYKFDCIVVAANVHPFPGVASISRGEVRQQHSHVELCGRSLLAGKACVHG